MSDLNQLFDLASKHSDNGEKGKAIELYEQILAQREDWSTVHYNLGLIYKYQNNWKKSFHHNLRAVELNREEESSQWNLGIAATMLGEWKIARKCWNFFGMKYEEIDEDPWGNIGIAPVRLNPDTSGEVVWTTRIDPARSTIDSIPLPESEHRYGDLILNDGAPMGTRIRNGMEYSVFNELERLKKSDFITYSILTTFIKEDNFISLEKRCREVGIEIENWTESINILCKQCSEGTPHEVHDGKPDFKLTEMKVAFACDSEELITKTVNEWSFDTGIEFNEFLQY